MRVICASLTLLLIVAAEGSVPSYTINLNRRPYDRWREVGIRYGKQVQAGIDMAFRNRYPKLVVSSLLAISSRIDKFLPSPYVDELRGLAAYGNISLPGLAFLQILYEATAFCTSIVCVTDKGVIWHARNLDYGLNGDEASFLKNDTINVNFVKDGVSVYKGTTYAGLLGLVTGLRPNGYSISLNQRNTGSLLANIVSLAAQILTKERFATAFMQIRSILNDVPDFQNAVTQFSTRFLIAPCYFIVGGLRNNEGVVITRNQLEAANILRLNVTEGRWFLVETNFDNWRPPKDHRRHAAKRAMEKMTRARISIANLFRVLFTPPVLNNETIYSTVMSSSNYTLVTLIP